MNHENTRLYQTSLELVFLADQLRRASTSVPLNFAEGCRKRSPKERAKFFDIATGSAREVSSIVDVMHVAEVITAEERAIAKDRCDHLCAMLYKFE